MPTQTLTDNVHNLGRSAGRSLHRHFSHASSFELRSVPLPSDVLSYALALPPRYKSWWMNLVSEDPIHVLIETVLIVFVLYMILARRRVDWRKSAGERLSREEEEELLKEWKERGRGGLVPKHEHDDGEGEQSFVGVNGIVGGVVVEGVVGSRLIIREGGAEQDASADDGKGDKGDEKEAKQSPTPSRSVLNFATHDFLGMSSCPDEDEDENDADSDKKDNGRGEDEKPSSSSSSPSSSDPPTVKSAARTALSRYGCGSCGPRGFYGTIDAHLDLEQSISEFTQTQGAIMYSDGASACTSTVAAFAKRGDLLVCDENVYEALGTGVTLSRANVRYFRHNDVDDLRRVLERIEATDRRLGRKSRDQRRFIVVEGVYRNYGTVAPLDEIVELKNEFRYRLVLDESHSFGTLGATGRGAVEHFGLRPMLDVEIITISLENALGSIGGVTVGNEEVVDHQRLSGAGYCFSASAPPFTARAAAAALERMKAKPELLDKLRSNRERMNEALEGRDEGKVLGGIVPERLVVGSDPLSPIVFLELAPPSEDGDASSALDGLTREEQSAVLDVVAASCLRRGVALVSTGGHVMDHLHKIPPPSLRLTLSASQSAEDVDEAVRVLRDAVLEVVGEE